MIDWENIQLDEEEQQIEDEIEQFIPLSRGEHEKLMRIIQDARDTKKPF